MALPTGSISHGTLRAEDLLPCFIDAFEQCLDHAAVHGHPFYDAQDIAHLTATVPEYRLRCKLPGYFDREGAQYDLDELFGLLNDLGPEDHYFGAHPGDGSDFGWWRMDDDV